MDRVFLDANVLFSAAYRPAAGLSRLWNLEEVQLVTSRYALAEAETNLQQPDQRNRLAELITSVEVLEPVSDVPLPHGIRLPEKDRPILAAAIGAACTHLLTGDVTHFGPLHGHSVAGVRVLLPSAYLRARGG